MVFSFQKFLTWTYQKVKRRDIFKESISLTYKGEESYSSIIGGISTIIIFLILITISVFLFIRMFQRDDISWNQNVVFEDLGTSNKSITITENDNIEIYIIHQYWTNLNEQKVKDMSRYYGIFLKLFIPKKGVIKMNQTKWQDQNYLDSLVGSAKDGIISSVNQIPAKVYRKGYWFNLEGLSFAGDITNTELFSGAAIGLSYWYTHPSTCHSPSAIHEFMKYSLITTTIKSNYVDLNDIQNPIKPYYFTQRGFEISREKTDSITLKVASNQVTLEDSLLSNLLSSDKRNFNSISMTDSISQSFFWNFSKSYIRIQSRNPVR